MQHTSNVARCPRAALTGALTAGLIALSALAAGTASARAGEPKGRPAVGAGKCVSVAGVLLERAGEGRWRAVSPKETLPPDTLLVALPRAEIDSADGAVRLVLLADVGQRGPYPVLESGVILHKNPQVGLDATLDRGLIGLENRRKDGPAKVRLRVAGASWELTLREPGTKVSMEVYGRHPAGIPKLTGGKLDPPVADFVLLVERGSAFLDLGEQGFGLRAPPGPAVVHWDSVSRMPEVRRLEKLPDAVKPLDDKEGKVFQEICACAHHLAGKDVGARAAKLLDADKKVERLVGVTALGAVDDLPRLLGALADPKHADVRDHAVLVLRSWIGRGPGQAEKLYKALLADPNYTAPRAKTLVQLLFGFDDEQRRRPETYGLLIEYLKHSKLPVRELAHWHLVRLAPAGKGIPYDAAGTEGERDRAYQEWRRLIPEGRLPPRPTSAPPAKQ